MASTSFYRSRSKASDRVGRIGSSANRASSYIMSSDLPSTSSYSSYSSSSVTRPSRATRDSSLGASYRLSSATTSSYVPSSPMTPRRRESSVTLSSPSLNRRSTDVSAAGLGVETAKFNREQSIQDIKASFDRQFQDTQKKLRPVGSGGGEEDSMSRARAKILGNVPTVWDDVTMKRNCLSDMYTEMKNFSSKTVAAINSVADCDFTKKKSEYNWRKDLEDYEKSQNFERDVRIRNIDTSRKRKEAAESNVSYRSSTTNRGSSNNASQRSSSSTAGRPPLAPSPTSTPAAKERKVEIKQVQQPVQAPLPPKKVTISTSANTTTTFSSNATNASNDSNSSSTPTSRKSWRERHNEKQEKQKAAIIAEFSAGAEQRAKEMVSSHLDSSAEKVKAPSVEPVAIPKPKPVVKEGEEAKEGDAAPEEEEEDKDVHGTKKMKSDFASMMDNLEQDMEAGRSKLSKLREKIRKAKASIKAADDAQAEEDRKRAS